MKRILSWCILLTLTPACGLAATADVGFSGTWSGTFEIRFDDGRIVNDTAWLVFEQSGASVTGSVGPKAGEQGPIREASASGNELRFVADSTTGKILKFVLRRKGEQLSGEANGEIGDDRVRVVLNVMRVDTGAHAAAPDPLYQRMLSLDAALFDSFNHCSDPAQLERHAAFFAKDVEFYHDLGGVTLGVEAMMRNTRQNVCGKFRRELDPASFRVFPIPGYGAMVIGKHRFCHTATTCEGSGEFTTVWRDKDGTWQITRALSYAHRAL
jgi:hypothetical protein